MYNYSQMYNLELKIFQLYAVQVSFTNSDILFDCKYNYMIYYYDILLNLSYI